jgi:hypothetical protein
MIAITTNSSISVKPRRRLPLTVRDTIETHALGARENVKDIIALGGHVRRTGIGPLAPGIGSRDAGLRIKRITRKTPQKRISVPLIWQYQIISKIEIYSLTFNN